MKKVKKIATSYTAFGTPVKTPFKVPYEFDAFETFDEMKAANALLKPKSHLKAVNAAEQQSKRTEALNAAYEAAGYTKPTAENSSEVRLKDMFKSLLKARTPDGQPKYSRERAAEMAEELTGDTWKKKPDMDTDVEDEDTEDTEEENGDETEQ